MTRPPRLHSLLSIALLGLALVACSDSSGPPSADATFTGRWAGERWEGGAYAVLVNGGDAGDTLYIGGSRPPNAGSMPLETVRIRVLFDGPGTYTLGSDTDRAQLDELTGGDVVHATYVTSGLNAGTLVITAFGGPGGEVQGRVDFAAVSSSPYRSYGPVASFVSGQFRATVNTYP